MEKKYLRWLMLAICLVFMMGCLEWVHAETQTTFRERLRGKLDFVEARWFRAPRRQHTDSSPFVEPPQQTPDRQRAFKKERRTWEDTWLRMPRKQHTDSSPFEDSPQQTPERQQAWKKRCRVFEDTWLNMPKKRNTDSSPFGTTGVDFRGGYMSARGK